MTKKSFTIIEMVVVILIIGLIFGMSQSFLNLKRQQKFTFGEQCVAYIFGRLQAFQQSTKYGKDEVSIVSGSDIVSNYIYLGGSSSPSNIRSYIALSLLNATGSSFGRKEYQFSHSMYSGSAGERPTLCKNNSYIIGFKSPTYPNGTIAIYTTPNGMFINNGDYTTNTLTFTGESIISTCDAINIQSGSSTLSVATGCVEIGKIYADRRLQTIQGFNCNNINTVQGTCGSRPSY